MSEANANNNVPDEELFNECQAALMKIFAILETDLKSVETADQQVAFVERVAGTGSLDHVAAHDVEPQVELGVEFLLPLLDEAVVKVGWITREAFLAGYGATQAVPGPLFTIASYLGFAPGNPVAGWSG